MNRYKYSSVNPSLIALTVGQVLRHKHTANVFGIIEYLAPNIKVVYGRPVDGDFVRASVLENMMDEDWIEFDDTEDLRYTFFVPKVYA